MKQSPSAVYGKTPRAFRRRKVMTLDEVAELIQSSIHTARRRLKEWRAGPLFFTQNYLRARQNSSDPFSSLRLLGLMTYDATDADWHAAFRCIGGGNRLALITTQFTRRARATLISKPTLPPARVQRLVIRSVESGVEYYGRHRRSLSPLVKAIVCVVTRTVTWSLSRP